MSHTTSNQFSVPSPTLNPEMYRSYAMRFQEEFITLGVLGGLYGVLTILSAISGYALLMQRNGRARPNVIVLGLTILALWASTTTYMVVCILHYQYDILNTLMTAGDSIWSYGDGAIFPFNPPQGLGEDYTMVRSCTNAATLTINVVLVDIIICWRTCVVWHKNRVVKAICGAFLLATFVLGVVDTCKSCQPLAEFVYPGNALNVLGALFEGLSVLPVGVAACVLSLSTNVITTLLVAYKAWQSRRRLRRYFVMGSRTSQVQKLLSLLIESGTIYSVLWAIMVTFHIGRYNSMSALSPSQSRFLEAFNSIANGALIPVIAIYPEVIIVLVAINRSHMEKGLTQHFESLPTPHVTLTANTLATSRHYENSPGELAGIDGEALRHGNDTPEEASQSTSTEPKIEGIV